MMIISQGATAQYNERGEEVSYWCYKRGDWITHKRYEQFYPFTTELPQPYKNKQHHQESNPKWQNERRMFL